MSDDANNTVDGMTGHSVGSHFWGMAIAYDQLEWARVEYKVTGYPLEELQEGWNWINNLAEEELYAQDPMEPDDEELVKWDWLNTIEVKEEQIG